jgi:hypothetical protein
LTADVHVNVILLFIRYLFNFPSDATELVQDHAGHAQGKSSSVDKEVQHGQRDEKKMF